MIDSFLNRITFGYTLCLATIALIIFGSGASFWWLLALLVCGMAIAPLIYTAAQIEQRIAQVGKGLAALRQGQFQPLHEQGTYMGLLPLVQGYNQVGRALERQQQELQAQLRYTALLTRLAIELRQSPDPQAIVRDILSVIDANADASGASIVLIAPDGTIEHANTIQRGQLQTIPAGRIRRMIERGLVGWVLRHSSSVVVADVANDERWVPLDEAPPQGSALALPISYNRQTLGVLMIVHTSREHFTSRDLLLLEGVVAQAGVALSLCQRYMHEQRRREQALLLFSMSQSLTTERSLTGLASELLRKSRSAFTACHTAFFLGSDNAAALTLFMEDGELERGALVGALSAAVEPAWRNQKAMSGPLAQQPHHGGQNEPLSYLALPLLHSGQGIGVFVLVRSGAASTSFSADTWSVLTIFTNVAAAAFANLQLVERLHVRAETLEQEVSERTRQMQQSRDLLRVIFDNLPDGLVLMDTRRQVLAANSSFCRSVLGLRPQAVVGKNYATVLGELQRSDYLSIDQHDGQSGLQRAVFTDIAGQQRFYEIDRYQVNSGTVGKEQLVERWRNVTRQEELHRKLLLNEQLATLGRLASSVVHEVGNPLQSVRGCLDLCREDPHISEVSADYLALANTELDRMSHILDRLRDLYRLPQTNWAASNLNRLVGEVRSITARQMAQGGVLLEMTLDEKLPMIWCQPDALRQVILNLVLNAHAAMPSGGRLQIATSFDAERREYRLSVHDTGTGISPERTARLFQPFQSGRNQGLGLGLYLSHQIVQQHNGTIEITSTPGEGTTAVVCLPWSGIPPQYQSNQHEAFALSQRGV